MAAHAEAKAAAKSKRSNTVIAPKEQIKRIREVINNAGQVVQRTVKEPKA